MNVVLGLDADIHVDYLLLMSKQGTCLQYVLVHLKWDFRSTRRYWRHIDGSRECFYINMISVLVNTWSTCTRDLISACLNEHFRDEECFADNKHSIICYSDSSFNKEESFPQVIPKHSLKNNISQPTLKHSIWKHSYHHHLHTHIYTVA